MYSEGVDTMIELPEALVLARQLNQAVCGKTVAAAAVNQSPHQFAFYHGDPAVYPDRLCGCTLHDASAYGGMVEMDFGRCRLVISDGVNLRFHEMPATRPKKHQLLLEFRDGTALSASVQMYGMLWCFEPGTFDNEYRAAARTKPSPLTPEFNRAWFQSLLNAEAVQKLSLKAFLATEQRIPGLGNGVLQDLLWSCGLHPRQKVSSLDDEAAGKLFLSIKTTLATMADAGGRDTEKDLFGQSGSYRASLSSLHQKEGCPRCGGEIRKESYLGGSIYTCPRCQPI